MNSDHILTQVNRLATVPATAVRYQPKVNQQQLADSFLEQYSGHTREAYRQDLQDFARWVGADSIATAATWFVGLSQGEVNQTALDYMAWLKEQGKAPGTINRRRAALKSLLRLARVTGLTTATLEVQRVRDEQYRDTTGPDTATFQAMLSDLANKAAYGNRKAIRDSAIVALLYYPALRVGEVTGLDLKHYEPGRTRLHVKGKQRGGREWVTIPPKAVEALERWLQARGNAAGPMFLSMRSLDAGTQGRLTTRQIYRLLVKGYGIKPHGLRHRAITSALEATGGDVGKVQFFSRHRSVTVLKTYDDRRRDLGGEVAKMLDQQQGPTAPAPQITEADLADLTETQRRRVRLALAGHAPVEIGRREGVSRATARGTLLECEQKIPALRQALELAGVRFPRSKPGPARFSGRAEHMERR